MLALGSKIGVITPSSALGEPEEIRNGLKWLQDAGYQVVLGDFVFEKERNQGGTAEQKAKDIMRFFKDSQIKALIASCGGYGAQAVLAHLDYDIIKQNPKPIIGFSDVTALQMGIYAQTGNVSAASIMLRFDFAKRPIHGLTESSFKAVMSGDIQNIKGGQTAVGGKAKGVLLGTNLCVLLSLAGTKYFPSLENAILVLEDVDEKTYTIERMLTQLKQQKDFGKLKGIVFGQFTDMSFNNPEDKSVIEIVDAFIEGLQIPVIKNFPFGHTAARYTLPLGGMAEINADDCILRI